MFRAALLSVAQRDPGTIEVDAEEQIQPADTARLAEKVGLVILADQMWNYWDCWKMSKRRWGQGCLCEHHDMSPPQDGQER